MPARKIYAVSQSTVIGKRKHSTHVLVSDDDDDDDDFVEQPQSSSKRLAKGGIRSRPIDDMQKGINKIKTTFSRCPKT